MDIGDVFDFGGALEYLRRCQSIKPNVKGDNYILANFMVVKKYLEQFNIDSNILTECNNWIKKLEANYSEDKKLTTKDSIEIREDTKRWANKLCSKFRAKNVIEVIKTGALNQDALLNLSQNKNNGFFDQEIWNKLSDIEKSDFSNSAKCLLAGIPTPSAIIALRGAEATVKNYCQFKTCTSANTKQWGSIVRELKTRSEELNIKASFLGFLDYVRDAKRNFAAHPNKIYTQREAELIFMQVLNLVQDTYCEINQAPEQSQDSETKTND